MTFSPWLSHFWPTSARCRDDLCWGPGCWWGFCNADHDVLLNNVQGSIRDSMNQKLGVSGVSDSVGWRCELECFGGWIWWEVTFFFECKAVFPQTNVGWSWSSSNEFRPSNFTCNIILTYYIYIYIYINYEYAYIHNVLKVFVKCWF